MKKIYLILILILGVFSFSSLQAKGKKRKKNKKVQEVSSKVEKRSCYKGVKVKTLLTLSAAVLSGLGTKAIIDNGNFDSKLSSATLATSAAVVPNIYATYLYGPMKDIFSGMNMTEDTLTIIGVTSASFFGAVNTYQFLS